MQTPQASAREIASGVYDVSIIPQFLLHVLDIEISDEEWKRVVSLALQSQMWIDPGEEGGASRSYSDCPAFTNASDSATQTALDSQLDSLSVGASESTARQSQISDLQSQLEEAERANSESNQHLKSFYFLERRNYPSQA